MRALISSTCRTTSARAARWPWPAARLSPAGSASCSRPARLRAVVATQDFHLDPGSHFSVHPDYAASWPPHCVVGTRRRLPPGSRHPAVDAVFFKGHAAAYSGFEGADPRDAARRLAADRQVDEVDVVGIATTTACGRPPRTRPRRFRPRPARPHRGRRPGIHREGHRGPAGRRRGALGACRRANLLRARQPSGRTSCTYGNPGYPLGRRGPGWAVYPRAAHHRTQVPRLALAAPPAAAGPRARSDQPAGSMLHGAGGVRPDAPSSRLHDPPLPRPGTYRPPGVPASPPPASRAASRRSNQAPATPPSPDRTAPPPPATARPGPGPAPAPAPARPRPGSGEPLKCSFRFHSA